MKTTLLKLTAAWPLVILVLFPALMRAETAVQAWVQRYNGPGNGWDEANAVVVDGSNNVIVTGYSRVTGTNSYYVTIKYSSDGVPLWTNRYNGPENGWDQASAVVVDSSNNVIVTGQSGGSGSSADYLTIKYSSAGVPLWTNRYNGPGNGYNSDYAYAMAVDGSNNVIVTGQSGGSGSSADYLTIKYSSAGVPLWTNRYNGPGNDSDWASAVAVDGSNNVIVTGSSAANAGDPVNYDYATIQYSSAGEPLWTNRYNGPANGDEGAYAMAVDGSNNVIVTGCSYGGGSYYDYATIQYSSAGVPLWTNRYRGPGNSDGQAWAVAVDGSNNVIVTGYSCNSGRVNRDYATIKYSSAGEPLWTNRYNGPGNGDDYAKAVAVDGSNNVIVTGYSYNGADYDCATIQYSSAGVPLWTNRYNGPGNGDDYPNAVAVDSNNSVIVTGFSIGSGTAFGAFDFATIKYVCVPSPVMTGLQRTNGTFHIRVDEVLQPGTLVIEASTNLAGWAAIFTNTAPTNVLFYSDPEAGSYLWRFYRAFQFP